MSTRESDRSIPLCFAAWQHAQGRTDVTPKGIAWEAFLAWWDDRDLVYFANLRQLARAAWNASSGESESKLTTFEDRARFDAWWARQANRVDSHALTAPSQREKRAVSR